MKVHIFEGRKQLLWLSGNCKWDFNWKNTFNSRILINLLNLITRMRLKLGSSIRRLISWLSSKNVIKWWKIFYFNEIIILVLVILHKAFDFKYKLVFKFSWNIKNFYEENYFLYSLFYKELKRSIMWFCTETKFDG